MTDVSLNIANQSLLAPTGLTQNDLQHVLDNVLSGHAVDAADLYLQNSVYESWILEDSIVKTGTFSVERGVGIRAISGEKTGFAYSDDLLLPALTEAANAARSIAHKGQSAHIQGWHNMGSQRLYPSINPIHSLKEQQKIEILKIVDAGI